MIGVADDFFNVAVVLEPLEGIALGGGIVPVEFDGSDIAKRPFLSPAELKEEPI